MTPLPLSIIIACKNRPQEVARLLADLRLQADVRLEIVLVDDGSQPPLPAQEVEIQVRHAESRGVSAARNSAIARCTGDFIVNFDDDVTIPDRSLLRRAIDIALAHPQAGIIGFRQRRPDGTLHYLQPAQCGELCRTSKFFGYAFLVRRQAIENVGPFYPRLPFGAEEIELSLRMLDGGFEILYAPSLEITHHESDVGRDWPRIRRLTIRNQFFTTIARHPWWFILPSLAIQSARFARMTARQERVDLRAFFFAVTGTLRALPALLRERKPIRFATLLRTRQLNRHPEIVGGGVSESNRPFDASAPKQRS